MISMAVILVVIVIVGSEIWVSRYGAQITNRVVAAYSILAIFGFVVEYLYWKPKYRSSRAVQC
jgi:predicted Na+-dependent transporter